MLVDNSQGITKTTSYAGGYIYEDTGSVESLQLFSHPEGYVEPSTTLGGAAFQYAFNYTDHLGNVRLTYADSNDDGTIQPASEIISEKHYYPFGLQQKGYNDVVTSNKNDVAELFNYQGQEQTIDLGLNIHEWKYRISDPSIGRFWQIDPLAEQYVYNGTYNFAENRVIDGNELEGLEWTRYESPNDKTINFVANVKVLNNTNVDNKTIKDIYLPAQKRIVESVMSKDFGDVAYKTTINFELVDSVNPDTDYYMELVNQEYTEVPADPVSIELGYDLRTYNIQMVLYTQLFLAWICLFKVIDLFH